MTKSVQQVKELLSDKLMRYFATTPEASAFETLLARLMDGMATYEAEKYGQQRLLAFINDPLNDPLPTKPFMRANWANTAA